MAHLQFQGVPDTIEVAVFIKATVVPSFATCAVIGCDHDQGVVGFAQLLNVIQNTAYVVIGLFQLRFKVSVIRGFGSRGRVN